MKRYEGWGTVLKKNVSLTVRIFLLTAALLIAACGVTFWCIASVMPGTYITQFNEKLSGYTTALIEELEVQPDLKHCERIFDAFLDQHNAGGWLENASGEQIYPPVDQTFTASRAQAVVVRSDVVGGVQANGQDISQELSNEQQVVWNSFMVNGEEYQVVLTGKAELVNEAVSALNKTLPYLVVAVGALSLLAAFFYSRYITRPILRLSRVSQKMAALDFSEHCNEQRKDEIGVLADGLNLLSENLSDTLERLHRNEATRTAFFAAASHELKTPITILEGHLDGMLDRIGDYRDHDKYLRRCRGTASQMEHLVQELLLVAKIDASASPHLEETDLCGQVRHCLLAYMDLLEQKGLKLSIQLPDTLACPLEIALFHQMLDNLLLNALRYSPPGETVAVSVEEEPLFAKVVVENSGACLPEAMPEQAFEPFYRGDSSRSKQTGGSGLGLYIVRSILERHHASYHLENTEQGVRFTFRLPLQPPENSIGNSTALHIPSTTD